MTVSSPYLMTFKNPTNPYFDVGENPAPWAVKPSDVRRKQRDALLQKANGAFDFDDDEPLPQTGGTRQQFPRAGGSLRTNEIVDVLDVDNDVDLVDVDSIPMEIPLTDFVSSGRNLEKSDSSRRGGGGSRIENNVVLVSDSD